MRARSKPGHWFTMDISDACSREFESVSPETTLSKVRGAFSTNDRARVLVVLDDGEFVGVVTRKQLLGSKHSPDEKVRSVMGNPPRVDRTEDVRETARLFVESGLNLLPVFEGEEFYGVVTTQGLLEHVQEYLDALSVADVATSQLLTVSPDATLGEVINQVREFGVSRLPVVDENDDAVGMVSVYDLVEFTVRDMDREQGGSLEGFDAHGGEGSRADYNATGGHGERSGFEARMLDLPARDVMSTPAETVEADRPLDEAAERMLEGNLSSLVVSSGDVAWPLGIVTTTDVLRALTWTGTCDSSVHVSARSTSVVVTIPSGQTTSPEETTSEERFPSSIRSAAASSGRSASMVSAGVLITSRAGRSSIRAAKPERSPHPSWVRKSPAEPSPPWASKPSWVPPCSRSISRTVNSTRS